jgi:beta-N-acetylhexosaminidase
MKALKGNFQNRTKSSYEAGCDIILHCNGDMFEMKEIAKQSRILEQKKIDYISKYID